MQVSNVMEINKGSHVQVSSSSPDIASWSGQYGKVKKTADIDGDKFCLVEFINGQKQEFLEHDLRCVDKDIKRREDRPVVSRPQIKKKRRWISGK